MMTAGIIAIGTGQSQVSGQEPGPLPPPLVNLDGDPGRLVFWQVPQLLVSHTEVLLASCCPHPPAERGEIWEHTPPYASSTKVGSLGTLSGRMD